VNNHPRASVVIPACNEELVIDSCLSALLDQARDGEFEVVVIANGCRDRTAEVARRFTGVTVVESPHPSKSDALNLGDDHVTCFPRIYLDADVVVSTAAARTVVETLQQGPALVAAPAISVDTGGRPWRVKAYYRVWTRLPYLRDQHIGTGLYALSHEGRSRFGSFPGLITDDLFVRNLFDRRERRSLNTVTFTCRAPMTLRGIVRIRSRSAAGIRQYRRLFPHYAERARSTDGTRRHRIRPLVRDPQLWPSLAVYGFVYCAAETWGWLRFRFGDLERWPADQPSRRAELQSDAHGAL